MGSCNLFIKKDAMNHRHLKTYLKEHVEKKFTNNDKQIIFREKEAAYERQ